MFLLVHACICMMSNVTNERYDFCDIIIFFLTNEEAEGMPKTVGHQSYASKVKPCYIYRKPPILPLMRFDI